MSIQLPTLDDRNFDQLVAEAARRIPSFTPEWTNFGVRSDPGFTLVELFAFLTDNLLYRANRIPERNRLKFLQLLGVPVQPAAPADGIIAIRNERGPLAALPLNAGIVVSAGNVDFLTRDPVNVLPVEGQVYYKRKIAPADPRYQEYSARYEAILVAQLAAEQDAAGTAGDAGTATGGTGATPQLTFYEPTLLPAPTPGDPDPAIDLLADTLDGALYVALLAPANVAPEEVRPLLANQTLSLGVVPVLSGDVAPLRPLAPAASADPTRVLLYELPDVAATSGIAYRRLQPLAGPDVLNEAGIVQVQLPGVEGLRTWGFDDPLQEGTEDYPPRIEDERVAARLVTWVRLRLPGPGPAAPAAPPNTRLTWVGINAARVAQAVPVVNEFVGTGSGEPDQSFTLANTPVLPASVAVLTQDITTGESAAWRQTADLLSAGPEELVYALDPAAGQLRFGTGLNGTRPPANARILVSYEYGGGLQGNVGIGALKTTRDPRLGGGYTIANPVPTSGGDRGETVPEAERRIPLYLRHRERLVTWQDFQDIARETPGVDVGRAEVLPLFLPGNPPRADAPGVVTVLVIPESDPVRPLWPTPDRQFLQRVCDYLDPRRLVTTEVYVRGPQYLPVYISVGVRVRAGYFADVVRATVRDTLKGYLAALPPGGPDGGGWPLGKRLQRKDLEATVTRIAGVEFVESLELGVGSPAAVEDYALSGLQLPYVVDPNVTEGTAEPLATVFGPPSAPVPGVRIVPVPVSRAKC